MTTVFEMDNVLWNNLLKQEGYKWWKLLTPKPQIRCAACGQEICCTKRLGIVVYNPKEKRHIPFCAGFNCGNDGFMYGLDLEAEEKKAKEAQK